MEASSHFRAIGSYSRILQVAEDLEQPRQILSDTFTDATWQDELLNQSREVAGQRVGDAGFGRPIEGFVHLLDPTFSKYPATKEWMGG